MRRVLNAAMRFVACVGPRYFVTEHMMALRWMPIRQRISFNLCLVMHVAATGQFPNYIRDIIKPLSTLLGRNRLRAAATG